MIKQISFLLIIIFIIGCNINGQNIPTEPLQKGTNGLEIEFLKNAPKTVTEGDIITIPIEIRNEGYANIKDAILMTYFEKDLMNFREWKNADNTKPGSENIIYFSLEGKSIYNSKGEKMILSSELMAKNIEKARKEMETTFGLTSCYKYSTILSDTICIDTDPNNVNIMEKTCKIKDISGTSQGAPVIISKVNYRISPKEDTVTISFKVTAENKGNGIVIDYNKYDEVCLGTDINKDMFNTISLKDISFSDYAYSTGDIICEPNPMILGPEGYFTQCKLKDDLGIPTTTITFETPIVIKLDYGYKTSKSHKIMIEKSYDPS